MTPRHRRSAIGENMKIELGERTAETVALYFYRAQQQTIKSTLPQKAKTLEEALQDYRDTLLPGAASFGRTIVADGVYVGDVWCYCIDYAGTPNAMLRYCVFDASYWNKGIATAAVSLFLCEVRKKFPPRTMGAFTFSDNRASIKVLEKSGFSFVEEFIEDGRKSQYFQRAF